MIWEQHFRAFATVVPYAMGGARHLCGGLSHQQWPFCEEYAPRDDATRAAATPGCPTGPGAAGAQNTLQLVAMACAYTDGGANHKGALYDAHRILNAQHASATPAFALGPVRRYEVAAVGLTPYGHLADSHFYASTAPWVLQLLHLLPSEVPILVSLSPRLSELYHHLGVDARCASTLEYCSTCVGFQTAGRHALHTAVVARRCIPNRPKEGRYCSPP